MSRKITELDCYIALAADEYSQYEKLSDKDSSLVIDAAAYISERIHSHLSGKNPFPKESVDLFNRLSEIANSLIEEGLI